MKYKRKLALLLAVVMAVTMTHIVPVEAGGNGLFGEMEAKSESLAASGDVSGKEPDVSEKESDVSGKDPDVSGKDPSMTETEPDVTEPAPTAVVSDLNAEYIEDRDTLSLSYQMENCAYVKVFVDGVEKEARYEKAVYECEVLEGVVYELRIVPYNVEDVAGEAAELVCQIPYKGAVVTKLDADYNLERQVLILDWSGKNMVCADVYQDGELIAEKTSGTRVILEIAFEPLSKHTYTVVPYNKNNEVGTEKTYELLVGDYVAKIENLQARYDEAARKIFLSWTDVYTQYVNIELNDEVLAEKYIGNSYEVSCELQPGASYIVSISPFNDKNRLGEEKTADISFGYFEIPDDFSAAQVSIPITDSYGNRTGFSRPSLQVTWDAQARAVYEIYRADSDRTGAYKWIATVKANVNGLYTYTDTKAGFGVYYYKIRRKIEEDAYIDQELYTALSDAEEVNALVPKPEITAGLNEDGNIAVSLTARKGYVSGYDIYRKCGKGGYKLLATIAGDEYIDEAIEFGKTYKYKAKAYYYDMATGAKTTSVYSKAATVKNAIGDLEAEIVAVTASKVKLTWNAAVNAKEYEVYYKSGTKGDSYTLWQTTNRTTLQRKIKKSGVHSFLIKACQTTEGGKTYFSSAEVSIKMGFAEPKGFKVKKTSYERNAATGALVQKDKLTWNRVYGAKGYYIDIYNAANQSYERIAKIKGGKKTSYTVRNTVTALPSTYTYRISAYKGSKVKKGGTLEVTPRLGKPEDVEAVKSGQRVLVSWGSVMSADRYQVYRSNGRTMLLVGETATTYLTDDGLNPNVPYKYYVYAMNTTEKLTSDRSDPATIMIKQAKVTDLTALNAAAGTVQLAWEASKNAQSYIIYYKDSEKGEYKKLTEILDKKMLYLHQNLKKGKTYYYKVVAVQTNCAGVVVESDGVLASIKVVK